MKGTTLDLSDLTEDQRNYVEAFAYAVKTDGKESLEYRTPEGAWVACPKKWQCHFSISEFHRLRKPTAEDYLAGHKASGLKVGDRVRVLREPESREAGWQNNWSTASAGSSLTGLTFTIISDDDTSGFGLNTPWENRLPYFVLEKIEPKYRPWTPEEAIGKVFVIPDTPLTDHEILTILSVRNNSAITARNTPESNEFDLPTLLKSSYTQLDGSPCGVEITEEGAA